MAFVAIGIDRQKMTSLLEEYDTHICPACCAILSHGDGSATIVQHRVADLLSQNIPPSDAEAHDLQHTALDPASCIAQIQQRMDELADEMARLTIARAHLESHSHHVKSILHPMRSLPEDILREIFLWSTEGDEELYDESQDSLYPRRPQWVLSQVCRRWRDITLAFPRLWSSLYLYLDQSCIDPSPMSSSRLRLTLYLDRSANQKITVRINIDSVFWTLNFVHLAPLLRQSTLRWVDCRLDTTFKFVDDIFSDCDFSSLGHLSLDLFPGCDDKSKQLDTFKNTPLLRSLDYKNQYHEDRPVLFPWEQLTTVGLAAETLDDVLLSSIKKLTNVQRLMLQLWCIDLKRETLLFLLNNRLQFPFVTSLCLSGLVKKDAAQIKEVTSCLDMPAITELELKFSSAFDGSDEIIFPPFHSSVDLGQLMTLSIRFPHAFDPLAVGKLVAFLRLVPNLRKFCLSSFDISSGVFDALTLDNGYTSNVLPYVQILDFSDAGISEYIDITNILLMLESRCPLLGRETSSRSVLKQLCLSSSTVQCITTKLCTNDENRGRWDDLCTSIVLIVGEGDKS